jgi:hypothetical protein
MTLAQQLPPLQQHGSHVHAKTALQQRPAISVVTADGQRQDAGTAAGMEADSAAAAAAAVVGASSSATPPPALCLPITESSSSMGLELASAAWAAWLPQLALAPGRRIKVALHFRLLQHAAQQQQQQAPVLLSANDPVVAWASRGADDTIRCAGGSA